MIRSGQRTPATQWTLTCGDGFRRTRRTPGTDLRIKWSVPGEAVDPGYQGSLLWISLPAERQPGPDLR